MRSQKTKFFGNSKTVFSSTIKILLIVLMLTAVLSIAAEAKMPIISLTLINQDPQPVKAGDVVEVRLQVQNTGEAEAQDWNIEALPDYPFTLVEGQSAKQTITSLPRSPEVASTKVIIYRFKVDKDATRGFYDLAFTYSMKGAEGGAEKDFQIEVTSGGVAQITYEPTAISPGKLTDLVFTIKNTGKAPLNNLIFSWTEADNTILPVGSDNTQHISSLGIGESATLTYKTIASTTAEPDVYTMDLKLQYDAANQTETYTTKAGIFIGGETDFDVTFSESTKGTTSLAISNIGTNRALSVTVRVPDQEGFKVTGTTDAILGNLDKGDYTIASFQIRPAGRPTTQQGATQQGTPQKTGAPQFDANSRKNLTVIIDYTDTTGARITVKKTVPIQFSALNATTTGTFPGRTQTTTTSWTKYAYIIVAIGAILGLVYYIYKKWGSKRK
ncbi:Uncharacterised protein [uncultured archaeon]|nr:Uncharacterised protein [uncultured archaeon]